MNSATKNVVLNGVRNGEATFVTISWPLGTTLRSGSDTISNTRCVNGDSAINTATTASTAFMSRDRSSRRCDMSVPSASSSFSGSWLWG